MNRRDIYARSGRLMGWIQEGASGRIEAFGYDGRFHGYYYDGKSYDGDGRYLGDGYELLFMSAIADYQRQYPGDY